MSMGACFRRSTVNCSRHANISLQVEGAGRSAGAMWGNAFLAVVGENVPPQLVALLVSLVTPGVMERIARDQGRGGPVK